MKILALIVVFIWSSISLAQTSGEWTSDDSLKGRAMINTIEQSLDYFYADYSPEGNYDSIIEVLNYEADSVPEFSWLSFCVFVHLLSP